MEIKHERTTAVLRNGGCSASYDSFVVVLSAVLRLNFCAKNPPLRKAANRYSYEFCSQQYTSDGVATTVFDPGDAGYKGDIARSYFYMATRYRDKNMAISTEAQVMFAYSNNVCDFTLYSIDLLMSWHRNDPVSLKERIRNDAIYQHQGNRNPFIDYPCLAEYIWGDSIGKNVDFSKLASAYDATFSGQGCPCQQPYIIVSPDSLSFESTPNVPVTQTFTISAKILWAM